MPLRSDASMLKGTIASNPALGPTSTLGSGQRTGPRWFTAPPKLDSSYWNAVAERIDRRNFLPGVIAEFRAFAILDLLGFWCGGALSGSRLLKTDSYEEAFSSSSFLFELARQRADVTGIDISSAIVERARRNARRGRLASRFLSCDVRRLAFASGSFDIVVSHSTLDHFTREKDLLLSLSELRRVLRPSGTLVLTLDNRQNLGDLLVRLTKWLSPYYIGKSFLAAEVQDALRKIGLEVVETAYLAHSVRIVDIVVARAVVGFGSRRLEASFQRALRRFDSLCARTRVDRFFGTYVAVKAVRA